MSALKGSPTRRTGTGVAMATGDTLRKLIAAHNAEDDEGFRVAAQDLIQSERQNNHRLLADDLERLVLAKPRGTRVGVGPGTRGPLTALPRDRERGLPLIAAHEAEVAWHRVVLPEDVLGRLRRLTDEYRREGLLVSAGLLPTRTALFVGAPGTGKTMAARAIATELGYPLFVVRFDAIVSSLLGETAANLSKVFQFLESARGVVLFDEFDAVAKERSDETEHGELKRVVNALLQMMDGYKGSSLLIAATNHDKLLDSAIWRRFELVVHFPLPSPQDRELMLRRFLGGTYHDEASLRRVAQSTTGASGADLERIAIYAARSAALHQDNTIAYHHLADAVHEFKQRSTTEGVVNPLE